jgi:hypothetical protein
MKNLIITLSLILTLSIGCSKDYNTDNNNNCTAVTINKTPLPCVVWGVTLNGKTYPAENLPAEFEQEGLAACIEYELIPAPPAECTCCGTKIRVVSITRR